LLLQDLSQSLTHLMEDHYKIYFDTARELLRARLVNESEAKLLNIPAKSAVIHMERVTYSSERVPIEYLRTIWRSDRYDFAFELSRPRT
jgi:GntR family transcriptional regulator